MITMFSRSSVSITLVVVVIGFFGTVVSQKPEIVDEIWPEVQPLGRTGRLNCTVARRGTNQVSWKHINSSQTISIDDGIIVEPNPIDGGLRKFEVRRRQDGDREIYMLVIRRLRQQDAGAYTCIVRIGSVTSTEWPHKNGYLTVQVPPTIQDAKTTTVLQVDKGFDATLRCDATGIPYPNITWTRSDGGFLPVEPKAVFQYRSSELPLKNVDVSHMGVYRCVADNNIKPPAEHLAEVLVFHAPATRVVQNSVGQIQNQRATALLECIVQGHPEPTVAWYKEELGVPQRIMDNDDYEISKQTTDNQNLKAMESWYTLKVKNVQANDFTNFLCVATNEYGEASSTIVLFETTECQGANCPSLSPSSSRHLVPSVTWTFMACLLAVLRQTLAQQALHR